MTALERLTEEALKLGCSERRALVDQLIPTLQDDEETPPLSEAWRAAVLQRIAEVDSGAAKTIPWDEVRRELFEEPRGLATASPC